MYKNQMRKLGLFSFSERISVCGGGNLSNVHKYLMGGHK